MKIRVCELFAGVGGFRIGIENALGKDNVEFVYINEFDKYCNKSYEHYFGEKQDNRSITTVNAREIPDHDLLVGGFPCQSFSIAGKRGGFNDTRGTLFFDVARIIKEKRPRYILLENVKGLLSHDSGRTYKTILSTLTELDYDVQAMVLNSKNFGVPQNRERVFIIGNFRGEPRSEVFPIRKSEKESDATLGLQGVRQVAGSLRATDYKGTHNNIRELSMSLDASYHRGIDNHGQRTAIVGTLRTHKDGNGFREMKSGMSPTIPARAREDGSGQPVIKDGYAIRRLTPLECQRLQGFPDDFYDGIDISDTQKYKQMGNAVTTTVITEIIKRLYNK